MNVVQEAGRLAYLVGEDETDNPHDLKGQFAEWFSWMVGWKTEYERETGKVFVSKVPAWRAWV